MSRLACSNQDSSENRREQVSASVTSFVPGIARSTICLHALNLAFSDRFLRKFHLGFKSLVFIESPKPTPGAPVVSAKRLQQASTPLRLVKSFFYLGSSVALGTSKLISRPVEVQFRSTLASRAPESAASNRVPNPSTLGSSG